MGRILKALAFLFLLGAQADAAMVTYSWVTDSALGSVPTSASFQVDLLKVQTGQISQIDIQNITFAFPGIGPLSFTTGSSIGLDNLAFVDIATGLPKFASVNQGLAVIAYQGSLFSDTFLSITFGSPTGSSVDDRFNAINGGPGSLGSGRGHWVVSGYVAPQPNPIPEPSAFVLAGLGGMGVAGAILRRNRS